MVAVGVRLDARSHGNSNVNVTDRQAGMSIRIFASHAWVLFAIMSVGCSKPSPSQVQPLSADRVLREVHATYHGKRFTHVTFVQTTEHGDGRTERWYEALAPVGRVRVDIAPLEARNGFMYRADSQYVFRDGRIAQAYGGQRWLSMLLLLDIFALPIDRVLARASELGLRLGPAHESTWEGRRVIVAGAFPGDSLSPQVWYDREHLYPVRLIQRALPDGPLYDWHLDGHVFLDGGWIEGRIRIFSEGRLLVTETYDSITPRRALPDSLFLPAPLSRADWIRAP
jgi:hypothetical protein